MDGGTGGGVSRGCVVGVSEWGPMLLPVGDEYVAGAILKDGAYSAAEFQGWMPYLSFGATVLEVGAHCGAHTLALARAVGSRGKVVACEPQRGLAQMIAGTMALNGQSHVDVRNVGVSNVPGEVTLQDFDYATAGNFGGVVLRDAPNGFTVPVTTVDLLKVAPSFVKVDVEGMELQVLQGAERTIREHRPVWCVEADREAVNVKVIPWLRSHGYRLWWQVPPLGPSFPRQVSVNLLAVPEGQPEPVPNYTYRWQEGEVIPPNV